MADEQIAEDFDESIEKCKKISQIIPHVYNDIEQIKKISKSYKLNFNLQAAQELLSSLQELTIDTSSNQAKIKYVNEYREGLTLGLINLGNCLEEIGTWDSLDNAQQHKFSNISADIVKHQESIVKIAGS